MLARVANNLFWMGRYIERSEHIARYMHVNYFSSLDAPNELSRSRQFMLRSMLRMIGDPEPAADEELNEEEILYKLALDYAHPFSIINNVKYTRENANSARRRRRRNVQRVIKICKIFILLRSNKIQSTVRTRELRRTQ